MRNSLGSLFPYAIVVLLGGCLGSDGSGPAGTTSSSSSVPGTCASVTYDAPSGVANNITFVFDKSYSCGQFANGDWWVAVDGSGTVTITSISPAVSGGRNGYEVNPSAASMTQQGFDSTSSMPYNAALTPPLPLSLPGVSSVVKTVAGTPSPPNDLSVLQFAAVLTIVGSPVSNSTDTFRPGYFGSAGKNFYSVPSVAAVAALPSAVHTPIGVPSLAGFPISSVATRYRHVQLDHNTGFRGRTLHPIDNMQDYGAEIATDNAVYLLRLLLSDFDYSNASHKQALVNYLQMAIDLRSMAANGVTWDVDGGHGNGRKLPLQVANKVFGGTDFSNAIAASIFSEDLQVHRSTVTGEVLWGKAGTEAEYWRTTRGALGELAAGGSRDVRDFYGRIDGGGYEIGNSYQQCCTSGPWKYAVLALYLLGLEVPPATLPLPATSPLVEYVERWVRYGVKAADTTTSINLTTGVITSAPHGLPVCARPAVPSGALYGVSYGPDGLGSCLVGANNWIAIDNTSADNGGYGSTFGDELWAWYR